MQFSTGSTETTNYFRNELRLIRKKYNYSSTQLSRDITNSDRNIAYISRIENGKTKTISFEVIERIAQKISEYSNGRETKDELLEHFRTTLERDYYLEAQTDVFIENMPWEFAQSGIVQHTIATKLKENNLSSFEFLEKINTYNKEITILLPNGRKINRTVKFSPTFLDNLTKKSIEATYPQLFAILFYLYVESGCDEINAIENTKNILAQEYVKMDEIQDYIKNDNDYKGNLNYYNKQTFEVLPGHEPVVAIYNRLALIYDTITSKQQDDISKNFTALLDTSPSFVYAILCLDFASIYKNYENKEGLLKRFLKEMQDLVDDFSS